MNIDAKMVDYVAELAKLRLSEEEKLRMGEDLNNILVYMDILNELDTENVQAMTHVFDVNNVFRADEIKASYPREEILKNALAVEDGCFVVPKTVE
ncbi:MAG: Asp-tRNA(Asn)/Glu-tRNA(Gln) amidotransferase subunit GatC [Clostridia bacterium]|nr:Asp-tRNA(Asn)/Glu-tRNA(Gln) amidotransferase subunit GatC [Clostridia bacterium]MDD4571803.1 Asp-tRNA(Asn)/Glu-tRNA(Gln) amidotransferase subunit GatC [Clostridia bacterium]